VLGIGGLDEDGEEDRDEVKGDPEAEPVPGTAREVDPDDEDEGDAGQPLDDRTRDDDPALDEIGQCGGEAPFRGDFWAWLPMIGKTNVGPNTTMAPKT
jgi:hypothetical protein